MKRRDQLKLVLLAQLVGAVAIGAWFLIGRSRAEPLELLPELVETIRARGPNAAVSALGDPVFEGALGACRRDVCISMRYNGDSAQWAFKTSATGRDACADFRHPDCSDAKVRAELAKVLRHIENVGCDVSSVMLSGPRKGLKVRCGGVGDFLPLRRDVAGWAFAPHERAPAFLPNVYAAIVGK